jgi:putative NIF3 family GTP cyclohydrolase 1 type 2
VKRYYCNRIRQGVATTTQRIMRVGLELAGWSKKPADTAVHVPGSNIRKVLMAIDVGVAELPLAGALGCDAVIAHHPIGVASVNFYKVFDRHVEFMTEHGVPARVARKAVKKLKERVETRTHAEIYSQTVSAAKALGMPLVNIHQPCDEYMRQAILSKIRSGKTERVRDLLESVNSIPEFSNAAVRPAVRCGNAGSKLGQWALVIAAGTNGGYGIAKAYFEYGTDTLIYLHIDHGELLKLREEKCTGNLVILGHLAGDSLGMNALADRLEKQEGVETVRIGILPAT